MLRGEAAWFRCPLLLEGLTWLLLLTTWCLRMSELYIEVLWMYAVFAEVVVESSELLLSDEACEDVTCSVGRMLV